MSSWAYSSGGSGRDPLPPIRFSQIQPMVGYLAAHKILVFEGGRVVEEGTRGELVEADGVYAELCRIQFRDAVERVEALPS